MSSPVDQQPQPKVLSRRAVPAIAFSNLLKWTLRHPTNNYVTSNQPCYVYGINLSPRLTACLYSFIVFIQNTFIILFLVYREAELRVSGQALHQKRLNEWPLGRRGAEASRSEPASCLSPLRTGHKLPFDHPRLQLCQSLVSKLTQFWILGRERERGKNTHLVLRQHFKYFQTCPVL